MPGNGVLRTHSFHPHGRPTPMGDRAPDFHEEMHLMHDHSPARRPGVAAEEERAWVGVYRRGGRDAAAAADVLSQLDRDPEMKRQHLALYLSCQAALRRHQAQQDRQQRLAGCLRRAWHRLLGRSMPDPTALPEPRPIAMAPDRRPTCWSVGMGHAGPRIVAAVPTQAANQGGTVPEIPIPLPPRRDPGAEPPRH